MRTNTLGQICDKHVEACRSLIHRPEGKNWVLPLDVIMPSLPHLRVVEGYVFEAVYTDNDFGCMCDYSIPYIRPKDRRPLNEFQWERWSDNIPDGYFSPLERMVGDGSPESAWEAVLLEDLYRRLPMFQHACYSIIDYITDLDEYPDLAGIKKYVDSETGLPLDVKEVPVEDLPRDNWKTPIYGYESYEQIREAQKYLNEPSILPEVIQIGNHTFTVKYYYWSEWSGLNEIIKEVSIGKDSITLKESSGKNLVEYHCGIWF